MTNTNDAGRENEFIAPRYFIQYVKPNKEGDRLDRETKQAAEAYARDYAVRELEALVANHLTDDGVRRYVRLHNFEESITRLKGEA